MKSQKRRWMHLFRVRHGRDMMGALALIAGIGASSAANAQTVLTFAPASGSWDTASNWSPAIIPSNGTNTYEAVIPAGRAVTLASARKVSKVTMGAGSQVALATFNLTTTTQFSMSSGTVGIGAGGVVLSQGSLTIDAGISGLVDICDTDINHTGKVATWNSGNILLDGSVLTIAPTSRFVISASAGTMTGDFALRGVDPPRILNNGTVVIDRGGVETPVRILSTSLENASGAVCVLDGALLADGVLLDPGNALPGDWFVENTGELHLESPVGVPQSILALGGIVALDGQSASFPALQSPTGMTSLLSAVEVEGTLILEGGAALTTLSGLTSHGTIRLDGSNGEPMLLVQGVFDQYGETDLFSTSGTDSVLDADGGVHVRPTGLLRGSGAVLGSVTNEGSVSPGRPTGTLAVTGSYTQAGEFVAVIRSESDFSRMTVSGTASLGGTLRVEIAPGFTAAPGQMFEILSAGVRAGTFNVLDLPNLPNTAPVTFEVLYSAGAVTLRVPTGTPVGGACCLPSGMCVHRTSGAACSADGGIFQGAGVTCADGLCPQPVGACCKQDGTCLIADATLCSSLAGVFQGVGSLCFGSAPTYDIERSDDNDLGKFDHTGEPLTLGNNSGAQIPIGFAFEHFGVVHSTVRVSSNGYLTFGTMVSAAANAAFPSAAAPNNLIAPLWDDWNQTTASGAEIDYQTIGDPGQRQLIVQWTRIPQFGGSDSNTFQVRLHECGGLVEFRYGALTPPAPPSDYSVGIENAAGTLGVNIDPESIGTGDSIILRPTTLCPPPNGACCLSDRSCQYTDREACGEMGGHFDGPLTVCTSASCCVSEEEVIEDVRQDGDSAASLVDLNGTISPNEYGAGNTQVYAGAGAGFGGHLGSGLLFMDRDAANLYIALAGGGPINANDHIVILLDTRAGGFTDAQMNDTLDAGRRAASNLTANADDIFPSGFLPDYALVIGATSRSLYQLAAGSLIFISTPTMGVNGAATVREFSLPLAALNAGASIDFFAAYCSGSNFLSNEGIPAQSFSSIPNIGFGVSGTYVDWCHANRFEDGSCSRYLLGDRDNFAAAGEDEDMGTAPRPDFAAFLGRSAGNNAMFHGGQILPLDTLSPNKWTFGHTFAGLPSSMGGATLEVHVRAGSFQQGDDGISLQFFRPPPSFVWNGFFSDLEQLAGGNGVWSPDDDRVFVLDLANLPVPSGPPVNLIDDMSASGFLDVYIQNGTAVDYVELCLTDPPTGCCCLPDNASMIATASACATLGGSYLGDDVSCDAPGGGAFQFPSGVVNLPIPDNSPAGISSTVNVATDVFIQSISFDVTMRHAWIGDVICRVTFTPADSSPPIMADLFRRPNSTTVGGTAGTAGDSSNLGIGATPVLYNFVDTAPTTIWTAALAGDSTYNIPPGQYRAVTAANMPVDLNFAFGGRSVRGAWTISISDNAGADTGALTSWAINVLEPAGAPPCANATGACCVDRCTCDLMTEAACQIAGGEFQGTGVSCEAAACDGGCPCDWNGADGLDSQDYFDFLTSFFEADADFNCDAITDSQDYFDFLTCFFDGCGA